MYNLLYSTLSTVISQISSDISHYAFILSYHCFGYSGSEYKIQNKTLTVLIKPVPTNSKCIPSVYPTLPNYIMT